MSGQTMVAEPAAPAVTAAATGPQQGRARLLVPKAAAVQQVKAHVDRGARLGRAGIRSMDDLDALRAKKQEWVQSYTELLLGLYDEPAAAADECNDWVGPILPEYADLELFADQFYEEVAHRLGRLRAVLKRLTETPEVVRRTEPLRDVHPAVDGHVTPDAVKSEPPKPVAVAAPSAVPAAPAAPKAPAATPPPAVKGVLVANGDDAAKPAVTRFMAEMGVGLVELPAQSTAGGDGAFNGASFAVVVLAAGDAAALSGGTGADPLPAHCRAALFRLGYLAGRLGPQRVFVVHPPTDGAPVDPKQGPGDPGVPFLPLDAAGGWQLNLARGLRRAGVPVDLNRMC